MCVCVCVCVCVHVYTGSHSGTVVRIWMWAKNWPVSICLTFCPFSWHFLHFLFLSDCLSAMIHSLIFIQCILARLEPTESKAIKKKKKIVICRTNVCCCFFERGVTPKIRTFVYTVPLKKHFQKPILFCFDLNPLRQMHFCRFDDTE